MSSLCKHLPIENCVPHFVAVRPRSTGAACLFHAVSVTAARLALTRRAILHHAAVHQPQHGTLPERIPAMWSRKNATNHRHGLPRLPCNGVQGLYGSEAHANKDSVR